MKTCVSCKKPLEDSAFYPRSGKPHLTNSECKDCMKTRSLNQTPLPVGTSRVATEMDVIGILARYGIPAQPGRDLRHKWVDVIAWGNVLIEVKSSTRRSYGQFIFMLSPKQQQRGLLADLVVLICKQPTGDTYHIFPVDHPIFYSSGVRKESVVYAQTAPNRRIPTRKGREIVPLTPHLMQSHQDKWSLVTEIRDLKSDALRLQHTVSAQ
jgi:hypothetical protein